MKSTHTRRAVSEISGNSEALKTRFLLGNKVLDFLSDPELLQKPQVTIQ